MKADSSELRAVGCWFSPYCFLLIRTSEHNISWLMTDFIGPKVEKKHFLKGAVRVCVTLNWWSWLVRACKYTVSMYKSMERTACLMITFTSVKSRLVMFKIRRHIGSAHLQEIPSIAASKLIQEHDRQKSNTNAVVSERDRVWGKSKKKVLSVFQPFVKGWILLDRTWRALRGLFPAHKWSSFILKEQLTVEKRKIFGERD